MSSAWTLSPHPAPWIARSAVLMVVFLNAGATLLILADAATAAFLEAHM